MRNQDYISNKAIRFISNVLLVLLVILLFVSKALRYEIPGWGWAISFVSLVVVAIIALRNKKK